MAINLELRYRGLRAPHKIKMACLGCARECAEARGKDVGVIATENGWNLYVGGNGGMTPKTRDLLAGDLDDETLVRYIDRFLMFYIRTADRLQRTAPWVEALDGGLDHLRDVVCNDSLGPGRRIRRGDRPSRRGLRVRVEGRARRPGQAVAVRVLRQRARCRRSHGRRSRSDQAAKSPIGLPKVPQK